MPQNNDHITLEELPLIPVISHISIIPVENYPIRLKKLF